MGNRGCSPLHACVDADLMAQKFRRKDVRLWRKIFETTLLLYESVWRNGNAGARGGRLDAQRADRRPSPRAPDDTTAGIMVLIIQK